MDFEGFSSSKFSCSVTHRRSNSLPDNRVTEEQSNSVHSAEPALTKMAKETDTSDVQNSLRREISTLEKILHEQVSVRCALEKALGYKTVSHDITNEAIIPKPAIELIREIAVMELEVGHLEQYLLSLYRKAFDKKIPSLSPNKNESLKSPIFVTEDGPLEEKLLDSSCVQRSHSSLSQITVLPDETSAPAEAYCRALRTCHSQPLSMMEYAQNSSPPVISLAEHLRTCISDHVPETPNKVSEDMVKYMCNIYYKLSKPSLANPSLSSPTSSLSCSSGFSPEDHCDNWSPGIRKVSSFDLRLDNPFHVEGLKDFSGPYSSMVEVQCIYRNSQNLDRIECLLQKYRSLVSRLEEIDLRKMTHEEKLAFWVNVHNALVMHAFVAFGVPQNNMRRMFLLLKAAYNIGGRIVSADAIQISILGCRLSRPGQWLRLLLPSKTKFKTGDERYGIERAEPLLYFALSSGSHSDPAIRIFTPNKIHQELEAAKRDYIRATFGVGKDHIILLPKILDSFAKDSGLCQIGVLEMIQESLPDSLRKCIKKCQQTKMKKCQLAKNKKSIEWVPHNFGFRYIIMKELVK